MENSIGCFNSCTYVPYFHTSAHLQLQQDPEKNKVKDRFIGCVWTPHPKVQNDNEHLNFFPNLKLLIRDGLDLQHHEGQGHSR